MCAGRRQRAAHHTVLGLAVLTVSCLSSPAYADGWTALTGVGLARDIHLWIGNAVIGLLEGALIALVFRLRFRRVIPIMIGANYASSWLAFLLLYAFGEGAITRLLGNEPLYALPGVLRLLVGVAFVETLLVEWPFCLWAMKPGKRRVVRSAGACLLAQVASYALLIPNYRGSSVFNLYTDMRVDRLAISQAPASIFVYFISLKGDAVHRINLNGTGLAKVCQLDAPRPSDSLFFRRSKAAAAWDLCRSYYSPEGREEQSTLLENLPVRAGGWRWNGEGEEQEGPYNASSQVCDLRTNPDPRWMVTAAKDALYLRDNRSQQSSFIGLGTPILAWYATQPTILPGDMVVCQFGNQILLLDLNRRRVGFLTLGRGPVVAIVEPSRETQPASRPEGERPDMVNGRD